MMIYRHNTKNMYLNPSTNFTIVIIIQRFEFLCSIPEYIEINLIIVFKICMFYIMH